MAELSTVTWKKDGELISERRATADDPPEASPDPPDVEATATGAQVLLRQRGTQRFVTWDRGDILDAEPEPAQRDTQ